MTDLSPLAHPWRHTPDPRGLPHLGTWECPHCLVQRTGLPENALCPDLVARDRAGIVAFLRKSAEEGCDPWMSYIADAIERGEDRVVRNRKEDNDNG